MTDFNDATENFLESVLKAAACSARGTWNNCWDLESKQSNLGTAGTYSGEGNIVTTKDSDDGNGKSNPCTGNLRCGTSGEAKDCYKQFTVEAQCPGVWRWGCRDWNGKTSSCDHSVLGCFPPKCR